MRDTLEALNELEDTLNRLDGREVHPGQGGGHADTPRGDTAEALAASLRRRKIVRER